MADVFHFFFARNLYKMNASVSITKNVYEYPEGYHLQGCYYIGDLCCLLQANLKQFMEAVRSNNTDKLNKMLNKGLDPNFHDTDSGGQLIVEWP